MTSFARQDYERLVSLSRHMMRVGKSGVSGKTAKLSLRLAAGEIFKMAEQVLGQQMPPLDAEFGHDWKEN